MAGWVLAVSFSASSGPSKQSLLSGSSSARSAASNTKRAGSDASNASLPMPTFCDP